MNTNEYKLKIEDLYITMYEALCLYARPRLYDKTLVYDAVNEAFAAACKKPKKLFDSPNPRGWILEALKLTILAFNREELQQATIAEKAELSYCDRSEQLFLNLEHRELLKQLGKEDHELLHMVHIQKLSAKEVASKLGISTEACKKRIQRAEKRGRKLLQNLIQDEGDV